MTTPKVKTSKSGDSRFYHHPDGDRPKVPGVTSVIDMLPKPFLKFWAAKLTAETAVDKLGAIVDMVVKGDRSGAIDYLKRAHLRSTSTAADTGTGAHDLFEHLAKGETLGRRDVHPDLLPYVQHFREFLDVWKPTFLFLEATVWSETHGYAGSFDAIAIIEVEGESLVIILDWKTTRSGVHDEVALQLTAYSKADYILRADGTKEPLPAIDGAAVLHVRPEGWKLIPVRLGDDLMDVFLALQKVLHWDKELSKTVLGKELSR